MPRKGRLTAAAPHDRPRERLADLGPAALSDIELLTLLIGSGCGGRSAGEVAAEMLRSAGGSYDALARVSVEGLCKLTGVGPASASRVVAALEIGRRVASRRVPRASSLRGASDVAALMAPRLQDLRHEEFHVLLLDAQHRLLRDVTVTRGILDASLVHPREIFRPAIEHSAAAVILVHNHPSGDPTPSADDRAVTRQARAAGTTIGIQVLDHVVVATDGYCSADPDG